MHHRCSSLGTRPKYEQIGDTLASQRDGDSRPRPSASGADEFDPDLHYDYRNYNELISLEIKPAGITLNTQINNI